MTNYSNVIYYNLFTKNSGGKQKMKTDTASFNSLSTDKSNDFITILKHITNNLTLPYAFLMVVGFFLGHTELIGDVMMLGFPFYAATVNLDMRKFWVACSVLLGVLFKGNMEELVVTALAILVYTIAIRLMKEKKAVPIQTQAFIGLLSVMIPGIMYSSLGGLLLYDIMIILMQSFIVFTMIFIFSRALDAYDSFCKRKTLSSEAAISLSIMMAFAVSGLGEISIFGFCLRNILSILIIILFSNRYGPGAGAAIGAVAGFIIGSLGSSIPYTISAYTFCGMFSGVLRKLGKFGTVIGFLLGNTVITIFLNGSTDVLIQLKEIVAASLIYMFIPENIIYKITGSIDLGNSEMSEKTGYSRKIRNLTISKLMKFSTAFKKLSETFNQISQTSETVDKQDISLMLDRVAERVCSSCSLCSYCWDRNFYNTYQAMFKILEKLEKKGRIHTEDIPTYFIERCERINEFVNQINNIYELFKVDVMWRNRLAESRALVAQQMQALAGLVSNLAKEVDFDVEFKEDVEEILYRELLKCEIKVKDVNVFENENGRLEITIQHKGCTGNMLCKTTIEKMVSKITGRKMIKEDKSCMLSGAGSNCVLNLSESEPYRITTGVASLSRHNAGISGDNYTFMNNDTGKYIAAISDGMGTGSKASKQSKATVALIENFMEAGFDKKTTVKLVNSALFLKSNDETFSTIDFTTVDLFTGQAEFIKVGAAPTFIKRDSVLESVKSVSLPAGLTSTIDTQPMHKMLDSGDILIMMSDGVIDVFGESFREALANIKAFINSIDSINPQTIADNIIDEAYTRSERKPEDDMTVLVAKIWKQY